MMLKPNLLPTAALAKRLTILYIAALGLIALLTIVGQILVQQAIIRLEGDSRIVNIAGRQRMLSQRLTRFALELSFSETSGEGETTRKEHTSKIREDLDIWSKNHAGLQLGSATLQLPGKNSQTVLTLFEEVAPHFEALKSLVESTIAKNPLVAERVLNSNQRHELGSHSDAFLSGMDAIVTQFEREARDRVNRLRWIESALLFATIAVLVCEGCFVFSPAVASLRRSITRLQNISNELEKAKVIAETANIAKTDFLARVSHELRTPLHAILGMLGLVESNRLPRTQRAKIRIASEASTSLLSLVDDLLDVASIEQGREVALHTKAIDLHSVISSTIEMMRPMASQKGLSLQLSLTPHVPRHTRIDADRLRQILTNLLQNAIRYTPQGHVHCEVDSRQNGFQLLLQLAVTDTGVGIPEAERERVFESFSRGNNDASPKSFGRGLGLGLSITKAMVKTLNGTITLKSKVGTGSTFTVQLPIQSIADSSSEAFVSLPDSDDVASKTITTKVKRPTALIVDDSQTNLLVMRSYLKRIGYRTMSVTSLAASIAKSQIHAFDLVMMDRHLPDGDGLDFPRMIDASLQNTKSNIGPMAKITHSKAAPKVFLVTAEIHLQPDNDDRLKQFAGVLHKPISMAQLANAINGPTNQSSASRPDVVTHDNEFEALICKLSGVVLRDLPLEIAAVRRMLADGDLSGISFAAHRLIGSAGNAGLSSIAELAIELEAISATGGSEEIAIVLQRLENELTDCHVANPE